MKNLRGRTALLTGASKGIGIHIARALASEGMNLILAARSDVERGVEIAKRIDTGSVDVNDFPQTYGTIEAPFGGRKASGIGQVNGPTGLRSYCHAQPVQVDRFGGKQTAGVFPRDNSQDDGFQKFIKFLWGTAAGRAISLMRVPF